MLSGAVWISTGRIPHFTFRAVAHSIYGGKFTMH
uniref:Uncharacterized protein n=1 Tax=Anguilla anguilla TaxID=7936 RepID=A0A0E9WDB1_ANGAN